jgi:hypothetical protein
MCVQIVANFCNHWFDKHGSWCGSSVGRLAGILMIMVATNALFYSALYDVHSPPPFACSFLFFSSKILITYKQDLKCHKNKYEFSIYNTPHKTILYLYSGWWMTCCLSSFQWQVLCERPRRWNWAYPPPHTFRHTCSQFMKISHKIFFNLIQKKKTIPLFITVSNHGSTQRIFTVQKNESALTVWNAQGLKELH